jgi:hypothetical protein
MKIAVIDCQGGGIGKKIIEKLKERLKEKSVESSFSKIDILALGTNSIATMEMLKAGATSGATGENAIKVMSQKVDIITGPIAICVPNSMMGEISEKIAFSIGTSDAKKILLPLNRCGLMVAGVKDCKVSELIDDLVTLIIKEIS